MNWPELSRKPALKTRGTTVDPTLRDPMQNGAEATALQWTRGRRQWDVSIDALTPDDVTELERFVREDASYGVNPFLFRDSRDPRNPVDLNVRFATLPAYTDAGNIENEFRQNCTFVLREV